VTKPIMSETDWAVLFMGGAFPDIYIKVWDLKIKIVVGGMDITQLIPDGQKLDFDAVHAAGRAITISGYYPPSKEILLAIEELRKKGHS